MFEKAIRGTGENRELEGLGTAPTLHMELSLVRPDGSRIERRVGFVQCVVGAAPGKRKAQQLVLYRVGLIDGQPCMVLSGKANSDVYKVVWEAWADGMRRAERRRSYKMKAR